MNLSKTLNFVFVFLCVGLCLSSVSHADSNVNTNLQSQNTSVEVNVPKKDEPYVNQEIQAGGDHTLKPRFEANWRYSNDRSILMGEFWLPLMQCEKESVLFCDIRLMGDDNENKEFNVGVGYREVLHDTVLGDGVAGAMIWFDRRFTDRDFQFNQVTVGGEWLGEQYDLRMNGYFPIDKNKSYLQANPNGTGVGFVGHQILVNTEQVVVEEVLPGIDFEVGSQLNFMNRITDSTRFFVGGYHFEADIAEDITGVRTRITSDITSDIQVGARFQHDDVRGSQTYVESTIRFPFGHKKKYKHQGVWSRLDESPERDIDVVSNETVTVNGTNEPLLNAMSGLEQNVIHVDNTVAGGGDGTIENPYNTLAIAEGVAITNDMIYVHTGDGTAINQNVGITLDDTGQMLAGSGTDLLYSTERFKSPNGNKITGALVPATTAPLITNGAGVGIDIRADNVFVSGITIDGAANNGIYVFNNSGSAWSKTTVENVTSDNNTTHGISVQVDGVGSAVTELSFNNNNISTNGSRGIHAHVLNSGNIGTLNFTNNTADSNNNYGVYVFTQSDGDIGTINFEDNSASNNVSYGFLAQASGAGSSVTSTNFTNNSAKGNGTFGFLASASTDGDLGTVNFTGNTAENNTSLGFQLQSTGSGSTITTAEFTNNSADSNGDLGISVIAVSDGDIGAVNLTGNTAENNTNYGLQIQANGSGSTITTANLNSNIASNHGSHGLWVLAQNDGDFGSVNLTGNTVESNTSNGVYVQVSGAGSTITTTKFTDNNANGNGNGLNVLAVGDGDIGTISFTNNTLENNTSYGSRAQADGAGSLISTINYTNNIARSNLSTGFLATASNSGNVTVANFTNNTADTNAGTGFHVLVNSGGDIGSSTLTSNTSMDNVGSGFRTEVNGAASTVTSAHFINNTADSNDAIGLHFYAGTDGDITRAVVEGNTVVNDSSYGIFINDDSAGGSIAVDLGGGAFGGEGNNRIFDNANDELLVDLDGGNLVAENNWWGSAAGLDGAEFSVQDASTADTTPFLTSDPR